MSENFQNDNLSDSLLDESEKLEEPPMYKVVLHNDDFTPMEFVVEILIKIFHKSQELAEQIMLKVHRQGVGVCGVYTFEIAETKVEQVHRTAERYSYPLRSSLEKA